jgi:hypothetical protein
MLNGDASEVEGRWEIVNEGSGRFLMIRSPGATEAVARLIFEKA